jgi:PAS domain S-box-containing protein
LERDRFFSVSPDMLCIAGFDGYFKQLSPAWEKTLGFTIEELMQKPLLEWIHPDDRERTKVEAERLTSGGMSTHFENRYLCRDGSYKWFLWSATSYSNEQLYYAVARDISTRKKRDEELRRSNIFLDSVIENIPYMVFIKDARDLKFIRFNKAGEELLGLSRDKLIGKNDFDFFPKEEAQFFTSKDRIVLENGILVDIPQEPIHTKKGVRILHTKKIPILDENGDAQYLLGISEDVTDKTRKK